MLEGLEATEIRLSELERTLRIDAEFFGKPFLDAVKCLGMNKTEVLTNVAAISDGNHFSISDEFQDDGVPYYRGQDVTGHFFIEQAQPRFIPHHAFSQPHMTRSHLRKGDALLSIVGTIGELGLVSSDVEATCSCKLAILRPRKIMAGYLAIFLKSRYGQDQIHRLKRGAVQMGLLLEDMDQLHIPRFSDEFERGVEESVKSAQETLNLSVQCYGEAEQTLLRALGLENWQPPEPLTYERTAKEVLETERFDAEHYHPKYDDLLKCVVATGIETRRLDKIVLPIKNGFDCRDFVDEGTSYIRVGDVKHGRINLDSALKIPLTTASIGKDIELQLGDVLFTRKGSFGNAAPVCEEAKDVIISSEIMLLRRRKEYRQNLLPEYLALFFNSVAGNLQAEKWAHGVAFYSVTQDDLGGLIIPLLPLPEQEKLSELMEQSETARKEAHSLLERAKRAVEIAIEEGEAAGVAYLNRGVAG